MVVVAWAVRVITMVFSTVAVLVIVLAMLGSTLVASRPALPVGVAVTVIVSAGTVSVTVVSAPLMVSVTVCADAD